MNTNQILLGLLGVPAYFALSAIWKGYVLSVLWGWFVVPLGAPPVTIPVAIGVSLVVSLLTKSVRPTDIDGELQLGKQAYIAAAGPALMLFVGWIVKAFL